MITLTANIVLDGADELDRVELHDALTDHLTGQTFEVATRLGRADRVTHYRQTPVVIDDIDIEAPGRADENAPALCESGLTSAAVRDGPCRCRGGACG
jgi:hypothetical protein